MYKIFCKLSSSNESIYVCIYFFKKEKKKKRMGNCLTLFKRECYVSYNLLYPSLKVTMAFD